MTIVDIVRVGLVIEGILIILGIFWLHTIKRMAVDLAVVWEFLGGLLFLAGLVPALSSWLGYLQTEVILALFLMEIICIVGWIEFSLLLSQLIMKSQELAVQVSLLNFENERVLAELREIEKKVILIDGGENRNEKDTVRYQYDGTGGSGDSAD